METTLTQNNEPHFPPAPERLLSVMVENLQWLALKAQGLHVERQQEEFAPSTRTALRDAMMKQQITTPDSDVRADFMVFSHGTLIRPILGEGWKLTEKEGA